MPEFAALQLTRSDSGLTTEVGQRDHDDLPEGNVEIEIAYSDLNYKDGLTMEPNSTLARNLPIIPGIDLCGRVVSSEDPRFNASDEVVLNGFGIGTDRDGGLCQRTRVPADWLIPIPQPLTLWEAAALGTAGYTSALAVLALRRLEVHPSDGPVLVTGAAGGAGSIAIMLLNKLGYEVVASTGRREEESGFLTSLGAARVIDRLGEPSSSPMSRALWAGAVDTVGSHTLVNVLAATQYGGAVAAMGMAQGLDLPGSVHPFILRGITLAGIDSVHAPEKRRVEAWDLLAAHIDRELLASIVETVGLEDAADRAMDILAGRVRGRIVVDVNK